MIPGAPIFWALALSIALNAALGWAYLAHTSRRVVLRDHLGGPTLQLTPLASRSTPRDRNAPRRTGLIPAVRNCAAEVNNEGITTMRSIQQRNAHAPLFQIHSQGG